MKTTLRSVCCLCLLCFALALGLPGCGKEKDKSSEAPIQGVPLPPPGPMDPSGRPLLITGGKYLSPPSAEMSQRHGGRACSRYDITTAGDTMVWRQHTYDNPDCSGALLGEVLLTGTVAELNADGTGIHDYTFTVASSRVVPHSILWTQRYGTGNSGDCQLELLPLHQEAEVSGKKCGPLGSFPFVGDLFQGSYRFEGLNTLRISLAPHEIPHSYGRPGERAAPRATRFALRYQREGTIGTATETDTDSGTATETETNTETNTETFTETETWTGTETFTDTDTWTDTDTFTTIGLFQ